MVSILTAKDLEKLGAVVQVAAPVLQALVAVLVDHLVVAAVAAAVVVALFAAAIVVVETVPVDLVVVLVLQAVPVAVPVGAHQVLKVTVVVQIQIVGSAKGRKIN